MYNVSIQFEREKGETIQVRKINPHVHLIHLNKMENSTSKCEFNISDVEASSATRNVSSTVHGEWEDKTQELIFIFQSIISSVGIIANATVVVVFMKHKKLRKKITNIFLINQVCTSFTYFSEKYCNRDKEWNIVNMKR